MTTEIKNPEMKFHYLSGHQLLNNLSKEQKQDLCNVTRVKTASKGQSIYFVTGSEDSVYLVLQGAIKIAETDDDGNEMIREIVKEGDFFGEIGLTSGSHRDEYAMALTDNTIVCSFKASSFEGILRSNPTLAVNYAKHMSRKLRTLEDRHASLVSKDAKTRVVNFFKEWAVREGKREGDRVLVKNYLTQSDIASFTSTSRQSVIALLNELRDSGMMMYNRRQIEITNTKWLAAA
jgi:CRP-like cAMP-binding protein